MLWIIAEFFVFTNEKVFANKFFHLRLPGHRCSTRGSRLLQSAGFPSTVCRMNFGRAILVLFSAVFLAGCEQKSIEVAPASTNLSIPAAPPAYQPPPLPTAAQPKLKTLQIFLGPEKLDAEMALSPQQQMIGMMFRTNLTDSDAMIFVFPYPYRASFWMKNCPESLSAAYIDADGVIQEIHHLEKQDTNSVIAASDKIQYVLEVKDGWFQRHNIGTGTVINTEFGSLKKTFFEK